jgi:hypothetical protein
VGARWKSSPLEEVLLHSIFELHQDQLGMCFEVLLEPRAGHWQSTHLRVTQQSALP